MSSMLITMHATSVVSVSSRSAKGPPFQHLLFSLTMPKWNSLVTTSAVDEGCSRKRKLPPPQVHVTSEGGARCQSRRDPSRGWLILPNTGLTVAGPVAKVGVSWGP